MLCPGEAGIIHPYEFEFPRAPIECRSSLGTPYTRSVAYGMPKIPHRILNSTVYLYPSRDDAERGTAFGGTGFILVYPWPDDPSMGIPYVVTNWHVAVQQGASVVRVNTPTG